MARRRSSYTIYTGEGEPPSRSRRAQRLPLDKFTLDRLNALTSPYANVGRSSLLNRSSRTSPAEYRKVRRLPDTPETIRPRRDLLNSLQLVGLKKTPFCAKRRSRREVLFSLQVAGRSGSAPGKRGHYRRTSESSFSCRR